MEEATFWKFIDGGNFFHNEIEKVWPYILFFHFRHWI